MKKDQFLELAGQLFDQANQVKESNLILLDKNVFDEIVDQISSDITDQGTGIIDEYELSMYSREVELDSVDFNHREIEKTIKDVLLRYFEMYLLL